MEPDVLPRIQEGENNIFPLAIIFSVCNPPPLATLPGLSYFTKYISLPFSLWPWQFWFLGDPFLWSCSRQRTWRRRWYRQGGPGPWMSRQPEINTKIISNQTLSIRQPLRNSLKYLYVTVYYGSQSKITATFLLLFQLAYVFYTWTWFDGKFASFSSKKHQ